MDSSRRMRGDKVSTYACNPWILAADSCRGREGVYIWRPEYQRTSIGSAYMSTSAAYGPFQGIVARLPCPVVSPSPPVYKMVHHNWTTESILLDQYLTQQFSPGTQERVREPWLQIRKQERVREPWLQIRKQGRGPGMGKSRRRQRKVDSKKPQRGGDAYSQARRRAEVKAAAKSRAALPQKFSDIPKYEIKTDLTVKELQAFFTRRRGHFSGVQSTACGTVPVTPPHVGPSDDDDGVENIITYHIVVFISVNGTLESLVRDHDGYVVAFRPQPENVDENSGWFYFEDIDLPAHLFGEDNMKLTYWEAVEVGDGFLDIMVEVLLGFNEENFEEQSPKRLRMIETLMVFLGEAQRLPIILRFLIINFKALPWVPLGIILAMWTNNWSKGSDATLHVMLALLAKKLLMDLDSENASESRKDALKNEADLRFARAKTFLSAFIKEKVPFTQEQFLSSIPVGFLDLMPACFLGDMWRMPKGLVDGKIPEEPVFGAHEPKNTLSLPLLISYFQVMKHEVNLVPQFIMRQDGYKEAHEVLK